jgi:hypothetical protein
MTTFCSVFVNFKPRLTLSASTDMVMAGPVADMGLIMVVPPLAQAKSLRRNQAVRGAYAAFPQYMDAVYTVCAREARKRMTNWGTIYCGQRRDAGYADNRLILLVASQFVVRRGWRQQR